VRTNDDAKVPVAQYHIYRRHFVFFRMSRHAFLEIKPEVTAEGLEKLIGTSSLHHVYVLVVEWMHRSELLVGGKEAQRHPEIPKLSIVSVWYSFLVRFSGDRPYRSATKNVTYLPIYALATIIVRQEIYDCKSMVSYLKPLLLKTSLTSAIPAQLSPR
jgi:hypothetical protein